MHLSSLVFRLLPIAKYRVSGKSMVPTYQPDDVVLINKRAYLFCSPKVGDVVVLQDPRSHSAILKRIAKKRNQQFFVTGDNLIGSTDSRQFGWVEKQAIIGKVVARL